MELCYCHYAILLGANQLFAAKQHRSDRSNGRQDHHRMLKDSPVCGEVLPESGLTFGFVLPFSGW